MASSKRLLPSLPSELIEEILYKTLPESLIRFKPTCKNWYALITDKTFIYNHLDHSPKRFISIDNNQKVWVTNKLSDEVVLFSKYFNVTSPNLPALHLHTDMARSCYSVGKHRNIVALCEGEVEEDNRWYTYLTLNEIDEGGIRKQTETGRHVNIDYLDPFICNYVYVPSLIPVPE